MISLQYVCLNLYKCPNRIICQHLLVWWPWKARACGMQTSWQKIGNRFLSNCCKYVCTYMHSHTHIYIYLFIDLFVSFYLFQFSFVSENSGSLKGHPQVWKGPIAYHMLAQKWCMANLGGIACRKKIMIYLTPGWRLCFLFDQESSLQGSELPEEVLLEEMLCKSLFPPARWGSLDFNPAPHHTTLS